MWGAHFLVNCYVDHAGCLAMNLGAMTKDVGLCLAWFVPPVRISYPDIEAPAALAGPVAPRPWPETISPSLDMVSMTDHPFPYEPWVKAGGHHAFDPFVALSFMAASTTRIKVCTLIVVAAYRHPYITAKAAASLDNLSGGRLVLGAAGLPQLSRQLGGR